jgi:hypothetical protein
MATLIELDRRYRSEKEALTFLPYLPAAAWLVVKGGDGYHHLQFTTDRPTAAMLKVFAKMYPTHTFRVLESDDWMSS